MKCYINYQAHQKIKPMQLIKKICCSFIIVFILQSNLSAQAVGYQGKKFMLEIGYSPLTTLSAKYFKYSFDDEYYTDSLEQEVLLFKHVPKIGIEYVIFNSGSVVLRYNPWKLTTTQSYYDNVNDEVHLMGAESKGSMITFGYKSYITATPAPLGSYYGIYVTDYIFNIAYTDSEFDKTPVPDEFKNFELAKESAIGLFGVLGFKNILWDQFTLDVSLEGGLFFQNTVDPITYTGDEFGPQYSPLSYESPHRANIINTNVFFLVSPTISVGWLAF